MGTVGGRNFIFSQAKYLFFNLILVLRNKEDGGAFGGAVG